VAVKVGKVIPRGGILGVERHGLLELDAGVVLVLRVIEKTAEGDVGAGVIRMALEEVLVFLADGREACLDAVVQRFAGNCGAFRRGVGVVAHHLVDGGHGRVVVVE